MNTYIVNITTTFNDIPHIATTLWYSGCKLRCDGCQNSELKDFQTGLTIDAVRAQLIERRKLTDWLVFLGGNPMDSIESVKMVSSIAVELGFQTFLYTGYDYDTFQKMFDSETHALLLKNFNYIKTGGYNRELSKSCAETAQDFFFETINQEVYKSENSHWDKFYSFDFEKHKIVGNFYLI